MEKDHGSYGEVAPVRLAHHFAHSVKFREMFAQGMNLVEETANFLDSEGKEAARNLSRTGTAIYGAESMKLTTRLMQLASWLLLQRAVAEGEMTSEQVVQEKRNIRLNQQQSNSNDAGWDELPGRFLELVRQSMSLQRRIQRLDAEIYSTSHGAERGRQNNPVASQQALLETAFGLRVRS